MRMRGGRTVTSAMPAAGMTAISMARMRSPARRSGVRGVQSPPAGNTPSPGETAAMASARLPRSVTASSGSHRVGAAWQRLAGIDARALSTATAPASRDRHRRSRRPRRQNRRATRSVRGGRCRSHHILGQRAAVRRRRRPISAASPLRPASSMSARIALSGRQARDALDAGIDGHSLYVMPANAGIQ